MHNKSDYGYIDGMINAPLGGFTLTGPGFEGFHIYKNDEGYYWDEGGYFFTVEECRADIHSWNSRHADLLSGDRTW